MYTWKIDQSFTAAVPNLRGARGRCSYETLSPDDLRSG